MPGTCELTTRADRFSEVWNDVAKVCGRIPPLWDLDNYVAVNPFLGFTSKPIGEAARIIGDGLRARVLPRLDFYREKWSSGELGSREVHFAALRAGVSHAVLESILSDPTHPAAFRDACSVSTFSERCDTANGTGWQDHVIRSIARWCAVYASDGGAQWGNARQGRSLFTSWLEAVRVDRSLEIIGLPGWRAFMRQVPDSPEDAVEAMMLRLQVPEPDRIPYFYRLLGNLYGWASHFRRSSWQQSSDEPGEVGELLAILLCADACIAHLTGTPQSEVAASQVENESIRLALQEALENQYAGGVIRALNPPPANTSHNHPAVQAIFCIDVRSEPLRRHLEVQSDSIETRGFAGFFGLTLDWHATGGHSARCPVLLKPSVSLKPSVAQNQWLITDVMNHIKSAPSAVFSYVEMLGIFYGLKLATDTLRIGGRRKDLDQESKFDFMQNDSGDGISLAVQIDLAAGILKNTGLGNHCAQIVLLCGHVGHSANNPHAAGLDCGACGGHGGAINARVAASLLNSPMVRKGLADRGIVIPRDTHFLPAIHDTSTDRVTFLDADRVPDTHATALATLRAWLDEASALVQAERAVGLQIPMRRPTLLEQFLRRRSSDWSEVRPEWGLARNAAFIAARRVRSRRVDLQGRVFLHEYDARSDADGTVLNLILSAPMVVASWINLQYFASTVDNDVFGCGNKALHNRIGSIGVVLGNGGDLRTGLALQSVHAPDGNYYHEPMRLQVIVEASAERIDAVLDAQKAVKDLVDNEWVRLFSLDANSQASFRRLPGGGWEAVA